MRAASLALLGLWACDRPSEPVRDASGAPRSGGVVRTGEACKRCAAPASVGVVDMPEISEASGLAASAVHAGVVYVHNDSGDRPRFFALDGSGQSLASYEVDGAFAVDWEDMAAGPCGAGYEAHARCLYFGDVGDNFELRSSATVYRVMEPATIEPGEHHVVGEALTFVYPDGSHDCETLLVHPLTGELFVVTKVKTGAGGVYRFPMPLTPGAQATLSWVAWVRAPVGSERFTAGDVHPEGSGVILRTYTHLFYYPMAGDVAAALSGAPCVLPVAAEKQGEAVAWAARGDGYLTTSEGSGETLYRAGCH
jgi:hypothetical protein